MHVCHDVEILLCTIRQRIERKNCFQVRFHFTKPCRLLRWRKSLSLKMVHMLSSETSSRFQIMWTHRSSLGECWNTSIKQWQKGRCHTASKWPARTQAPKATTSHQMASKDNNDNNDDHNKLLCLQPLEHGPGKQLRRPQRKHRIDLLRNINTSRANARKIRRHLPPACSREREREERRNSSYLCL